MKITTSILLTALFIVITSSPVANAQSSQTYRTYHNNRFNYSISYPAGVLYPQGEADNGDGQKFLSKDAEVVLIVFGSNNALGQTIKDMYAEASRGGTTDHPKRVITYKTLKNNWFVVSGYEKKKVFYQKTFLIGGVETTMRIEYPERRKRVFDNVTAKIARSFRVSTP